MKILLKISGTMEWYFPATEYHFSLGKDATLADLYEELAVVAGADISSAVWNHNKNRPRGPVLMCSEEGVLKNEKEPLCEGQILEFKRFLVGG